jgi:3-oxoadipate enol-lactonase
MLLTSDDAQIVYELRGRGPFLVLLHPYPTNHRFWEGIVDALAQDFCLLMPDLRAHGASSAGRGPATMEKHAADVLRLCDAVGLGKATFFGVSIGGYILFEFWRRYRERIQGLILCDTRAAADTAEGRASRLDIADDVERKGPDDYIDSMIPKLLGENTRRNRPDLVQRARAMMAEMKVAGMAAALRGMAARPDSTPALCTIHVPTLVVVGDEDTLTPVADAEFMRARIPGSQMARIPGAGHYAPFEQPEKTLSPVREFLSLLKLRQSI